MITVDFGRLGLKPGWRVLDAGCGSGRHTAEAARFRNVCALGVDQSAEDLNKARERLAFHQELGVTGGGSWGFLAADVTDLPWPDGCFDLVICAEVLEHVPDDGRAVRELARVLKPGRDLVVSVPRWLPERLCWLLSGDYHRANGGHVRIYKTDRLIGRLERAGLRLWARHYAHGLHSPYWWLKCLVGPDRDDSRLVDLYHRLLVWDMMKRPRLTAAVEKILNPLIGKSLVLYLRKE
ncbi:MAG: class I SAM-dependent methyltransferase [Thermodesulfobacteriota bacterium]